MKRILIIANKWYECDPLMNVLLNGNACPPALGWPTLLNYPRRRTNPAAPSAPNPSPQPRALFQLTNITAEVWCVSDLLANLPDIGQYQSSSERKAERLPLIFKGAAPDLVMAVGTAALPSPASENGCVVIGTQVFMHDCHPNGSNPDSKWNVGPFDQVLPSTLSTVAFKAFTTFDNNVTDRLLAVPLNPSWKVRVLAQQSYVALGSVNVTNPAEYAATDQATLEAFAKTRTAAQAMSVETTHGLIRAQSNAPFLFVSGLVNRVGWYGDEVAPRPYAQDTAAANNAGVAVAWMLLNIDKVL